MRTGARPVAVLKKTLAMIFSAPMVRFVTLAIVDVQTAQPRIFSVLAVHPMQSIVPANATVRLRRIVRAVVMAMLRKIAQASVMAMLKPIVRVCATATLKKTVQVNAMETRLSIA